MKQYFGQIQLEIAPVYQEGHVLLAEEARALDLKRAQKIFATVRRGWRNWTADQTSAHTQEEETEALQRILQEATEKFTWRVKKQPPRKPKTPVERLAWDICRSVVREGKTSAEARDKVVKTTWRNYLPAARQIIGATP